MSQTPGLDALLSTHPDTRAAVVIHDTGDVEIWARDRTPTGDFTAMLREVAGKLDEGDVTQVDRPTPEPDVWDDPDVQEWAADVVENLVPQIASSALTIQLLTPSAPDVKLAVELGFSMLLNKPVVVVVTPGVTVPPKVMAVADEVVEMPDLDPGSPATQQRLVAALDRLRERGLL